MTAISKKLVQKHDRLVPKIIGKTLLAAIKPFEWIDPWNNQNNRLSKDKSRNSSFENSDEKFVLEYEDQIVEISKGFGATFDKERGQVTGLDKLPELLQSYWNDKTRSKAEKIIERYGDRV